jgi:hypothetical protein
MRAYLTAAVLLTLIFGCGKQPEKKYEQVTVPRGAPRCVIRVVREDTSLDLPLLNETIKQFAKSNAFRECEAPHYSIYSGPGYPDALYKSDQFMIWSWEQEPRGVFHLAPHATNYTAQDFDRLTNALVGRLSELFASRVEVNPTNLSRR